MVRTRNSSALRLQVQIVAEDEEEAAAAASSSARREEKEELDRSEAAAMAAATAAIAADKADCDVEAELTSLSWLQSLDIMSASGLPTPPCSPTPLPPPPPPVVRQQPKKMSPLLKAQLGQYLYYCNYSLYYL